MRTPRRARFTEGRVEESSPEAANPLPPVDLREYARMVYRRRWAIFGIFFAVLLAGTVYTLRQKKLYTARTSVIIDPSAPQYLDKQVGEVTSNGPAYYWYNKEYYETQYKVITSRAVSQRVVDKLGLGSDPVFLGLDRVKDPEKRAELMKAADPVAILQSKLKVEPVKDSRVVYLAVTDADPVRAALLANELAEAYIDETLGLKAEITDQASEWLEERLTALGDQSRKSELALYDFKKQADMLTTSLEDRVNMVSQRLSALNAALTEVRLKIAGLRARADSVAELRKKVDQDESKWADLFEIPAPQQELIRQFKAEYVEARAECAELQERYLDNHPALIACRKKMQVADEALSRELKNIVLAQEVELSESLRKEKNLEKLLAETKAEAFEINKRQIEHDRLKRTAENDQRLYEMVLKRLKEIELSGMLKTSNVRILDKARPNTIPVKPNVPLYLTLAAVLGILLGVAGAFVFEWLDDSIVSQRDVEERLGLPFLGLVPRIVTKANDVSLDLHIHHNPRSSVAEHCRAVRTNLLFMSPDKPLKTIVVTSSGPQEGKSTNVVSLGIAMAQSGSRVLLVDTDMRRPRLHRTFGVPNDHGVSSLIMSSQTLHQAIKTTEVPGLYVLPCGPVPPNPAELLHTESFKSLLAQLADRFDRVILDSPPIGAVADALVLGVKADGVLLVLKAGSTRREMARRAVRSLFDVNARVYGAILNDVDLEDGRYGSYYSAFQRYGYYYAESTDKAAS
ncbi:MAG: polysaccharide biosynthesis tyrosine autokinase [Myxococcaceae bacterium]|nr:polysaccharide biosynthesis tyrosine autokinase [Myxococcaceae bacterium]